jgi:hypothetical protein
MKGALLKLHISSPFFIVVAQYFGHIRNEILWKEYPEIWTGIKLRNSQEQEERKVFFFA